KNTEGVKGRRSHPHRRNGREPRGRPSSSEIRVAWFELELAGKVTPMPGKKFVKSFWLLASGSKSERIKEWRFPKNEMYGLNHSASPWFEKRSGTRCFWRETCSSWRARISRISRPASGDSADAGGLL